MRTIDGAHSAGMESMTGFGSASGSDEHGELTIDIASVNHKQARVSLRSDIRDLALEERLRKQVQQGLVRGSITVQLRYSPHNKLGLDPAEVVAMYQQLDSLAHQAGAPQPSLDQAIRLCGGSSSALPEGVQSLASQVCEEAVAACRAMRQQEGDALTEAMQQASQQMADIRRQLETSAALRPAAVQERLQQRLNELLADQQIDEQTLARELAIQVDRIDVTEEMVRLVSHLDQLDQLLASSGPVGKKIEFLLQEVGRELNTTGAKANDPAVQNLVIEGKHLLDQLKEQAANCC